MYRYSYSYSSRYWSRCTSRHTIVVALALALIVSSLPTTAAQAQFGLPGLPQIVFDPTAVGKLVTQLGQQLQQINMQRQQFQAQVTAMRKLASPPWRDLSAAMAQVDALTRQGQAISYSLRNVDAVFQTTFPGVASVVGNGPANAPAAERLQAARTLATLRGVLNAASRAAAEFPIGLARVRNMKQQMAGVQGHEQALELNGTIGIYSAEQLTLLSQQLAALTNAQAVYFADEVNERAQVQANTRAFLTRLGQIPPSRPGFSFRP